MGITVPATILTKAKLCSAILGIGLLALTGCGSTASAVADTSAVTSATASPAPSVAPSPSSAPSAKPAPSPTPTPEVVITEEWIESDLPFESVRQDDPNAEVGRESLLVAGVVGLKATRFEVTLTDGVETGRVAVAEEVRVAPVNEVIGVGTKPVAIAPPPPPVQAAVPAGNCDPNYEGDCVPIDSDVDCASGSGNGPSYVQGPVRVVGTDIYGLDGSDGDGIGCEG